MVPDFAEVLFVFAGLAVLGLEVFAAGVFFAVEDFVVVVRRELPVVVVRRDVVVLALFAFSPSFTLGASTPSGLGYS